MNYKKQTHHLLKFALLAICFFVASARSDIVVVVSADSPISSLSKNQVAKIFLGKSRRFPDGSKAVPLNQSEGNLGRDAFYQLVTNKSPAQIKAHWSKLIFTGRGHPPKEATDNNAVKQLLANNRVNISYIDRGAVDNSVKVVAIKQ